MRQKGGVGIDDRKIIALFFERNEQAIKELSEKYGAVFTKVAYNILNNRQDAEECINEAYLAAWNTIPPHNPNPLLSYVCRIVRNLAIKKYRANTAAKRNSIYDAALDELENCFPLIWLDKCIGNNVVLHSGTVIGADGFGFAPDKEGHYNKIPQMGIVSIGDDVEIGANTTVDRATMGTTVVGDGTKLDNLIQVAHNVSIGSHTVIAAQAGVAGSAHVGSHCMIGGQVGVAGHIKVGDGVKIGAQSGIPNNVADGAVLMGYPAVPAREFMKQAALIKRLGDLFDRVRALEKAAGTK